MFRHNAKPQLFWKSNKHLHWSNPLRRWVYVKFSAIFLTGLFATPFISYFWTASMHHDKQPKETFANFTMQTFMEMAPLNLMSRTIGDVASSELIPQTAHHRAINFLAWMYGIDLNDYDSTLSSYRTAQQFFCRTFKDIKKARPIAQDALELVSPCDAEILQCGEVENGPNNKKVILQVKGHAYPIEGLFRMTLPMDFDNPFDQLALPPSSAAPTTADSSPTTTSVTPTTTATPIEQQQQGAELAHQLMTNPTGENTKIEIKRTSDTDIARMYFVFHLRPGDYHRVHSPRDQQIAKTLYVPGQLYPTTHAAMRWLPNLILSNERVLSYGFSYGDHNNNKISSSSSSSFITDAEAKEQKLKKKLTAMAFVGATCVGKIITTFDQRIVTNLADPPETTILRDYKDAAPKIKIGDEVAYFQWGSCVVLIADVDRKNLEKNGGKLCVKPGDEVKVGQRLL